MFYVHIIIYLKLQLLPATSALYFSCDHVTKPHLNLNLRDLYDCWCLC